MDLDFEEILSIQPYSLDKEEKSKLITQRLIELTDKHSKGCPEYRNMLEAIGFVKGNVISPLDLPFLPVSLFKELDLKSVGDEEIVKTMTSSGTTGQRVSKIYLDRATASYQQKAMVKIVSDFTGASRMPMLIIDTPSVLKDRNSFSARGAGILGFSMFGKDKCYALDENMKLDVDGVLSFLQKHEGEDIFLFGFTFMIWQHFYKELLRLKDEGTTIDLSNGIMIHGGGWKKLVSEAVSAQEFHDRLKDVCGLDRIHDYYGMVEQTGCIYMQCECGHLHASIFSDIITRNASDFSPCNIGEAGIIEVVSMLPESYPGHALLTEDEGVILGEDDCPCGRLGKYFKINGRLKNAEIRGCSDTYGDKFLRAAVGVDTNNSDLTNVNYVLGDKSALDAMPSLASKKPFSDDVVAFVSDVSKSLRHNSLSRNFADVMTLGFWLREASVREIQNRFISKDNTKRMLGRGMTFHIAPSNVPVNFAYSMFTALLLGNAVAIRIPSKDFLQVQIIVSAIEEALQLHENIRPYVVLMKYGHEPEVNRYISGLCDVRVIWGGDSTVEEIRKAPLNPRATEITFADRYSLAVIKTDDYLKSDDATKELLIQGFYNDTYLTDQNACTSPRIVAWLGDDQSRVSAMEDFYSRLHELVEAKYVLAPVWAVDKLKKAYMAATSGKEIVVKRQNEDNLIYRIRVELPDDSLMAYRGNSGFFFETEISSARELAALCNNTSCQTVGYFGDINILDELIDEGIKGVDRVVPIGKTMDFEMIWDGYDLTERLTRLIAIR